LVRQFFEDEHAEKLVVTAHCATGNVVLRMRVLEIRQQTSPDFGSKYKIKSPVLFRQGQIAR
jgi:hypothetical protein